MDDLPPCVSCTRSLNRSRGVVRRSFKLTNQYMQKSSFLITYFTEVLDDKQINENDYICRACVQRAQRYSKSMERFMTGLQQGESSQDVTSMQDSISDEEVPRRCTRSSKNKVGHEQHSEKKDLNEHIEQHNLDEEVISEQENSHFSAPYKQELKDPIEPDQPEEMFALDQENVSKDEAPIESSEEEMICKEEPDNDNISEEVVTQMAIPGYIGIPLNKDSCIFVGCTKLKLRKIPDDI